MEEQQQQINICIDELKLKKITDSNKYGCIFLHYTNILELVNIDYSYRKIERLPRLEYVN